VRKTFTTRDEQLKKTVISKLIRRITLHRLDLMEYYNKAADKLGLVSRIQWGLGLNACLGLDQVPFLRFQEPLGVNPITKPGDKIDYKRFLNKYKASNPELDALDEKKETSGSTKPIKGSSDEKGSLRDSLNQLLFSRRFQLETLFRHFDINKDGSITLEEFTQGIHALMSVIGKEFQATEIMRLLKSIDKDGNGEIDYQEFLEAFAPADPFISSQMIPTLNRSSTMGRIDGVAFHTKGGSKKEKEKEKEKEKDTTTFHTAKTPDSVPIAFADHDGDDQSTALLKGREATSSDPKDSKSSKGSKKTSEKGKDKKKKDSSKIKSKTTSSISPTSVDSELTPASFASTTTRDSRKHAS